MILHGLISNYHDAILHTRALQLLQLQGPSCSVLPSCFSYSAHDRGVNCSMAHVDVFLTCMLVAVPVTMYSACSRS